MVIVSATQRPVAVTLQVNPRATVLLAGKVAIVKPPANKFGHAPAAGQMAPPVGVQLVTEQLNPALGVSVMRAPSAAAGPELLTVIV